MKITSINVNKPDCKEFTTAFYEPVIKGEKGRKYTLIYEVEEPERYFENAFLIDCEKSTLGFKYPLEKGITEPILYEINQETDEKTPSSNLPKIDSDDKYKILHWEFEDIPKGKTYRIEW